MPLMHALEHQRFSEVGPLPQVLNMGDTFAVMLLCLQTGQELRAPESDDAETLFCVLSGAGTILEGDSEHSTKVGNVVHIPPGVSKALIAPEGNFIVLGVRALKGRHVRV